MSSCYLMRLLRVLAERKVEVPLPVPEWLVARVAGRTVLASPRLGCRDYSLIFEWECVNSPCRFGRLHFKCCKLCRVHVDLCAPEKEPLKHLLHDAREWLVLGVLALLLATGFAVVRTLASHRA